MSLLINNLERSKLNQLIEKNASRIVYNNQQNIENFWNAYWKLFYAIQSEDILNLEESLLLAKNNLINELVPDIFKCGMIRKQQLELSFENKIKKIKLVYKREYTNYSKENISTQFIGSYEDLLNPPFIWAFEITEIDEIDKTYEIEENNSLNYALAPILDSYHLKTNEEQNQDSCILM